MPNLLSKVIRKLLRTAPEEWNILIDQKVRALSDQELDGFCSLKVIDLPASKFWSWLHATELPFRKENYPHKKALEFFFSYQLLSPGDGDHMLDAAGGRSGYLDAVQLHSNCQHLYLTDHIYEGVAQAADGKYVVGGDISGINLPSDSLTRISCHHAFEHFQENKDTDFILEISRLLKPGGKACILPAFLTDNYIECWNREHSEKFDAAAELVVDLSASIPGADEDGHFARFYDREAYKRRVLDPATHSGLHATIYTCQLDGKELPDMQRNFGSNVNAPLHALLLEKPA